MSFLAKELQKNAKLLQKGAEKHIDDIQEFENTIRQISPQLENYFISNEKIEPLTLINCVKDYFKGDKIPFTAIDGTMFKTTVLEANIFFAGSYESSGFINVDNSLEIEYNHKYSNKGRGISSVVPLQVAEIVEIDTQFDLDILRSDYGVQISEDIVLDQSNIAESIMLFSEYFLAYQSIKKNMKDYKSQIVLLDRSLSGDHSALIARTQKQILWKNTVNLLGYQIRNSDFSPVNKNDLYWGRWFFTDYVDPIKPYFRFKILKILLNSIDPITYNEIMVNLQLERNQKNELISELKLLERKGYIIHTNKSFMLREEYKQSWKKVNLLVEEIGQRLFQTDIENLETKSPLLITKRDKQGKLVEKWITTRDLHFLTLFCMYMIIELASNNNLLVLGLTKDSGSREFRRQFLPISMAQTQEINVSSNIMKLPHSDRSFLQQITLLDSIKKIPWIISEYDAVYRTIMKDGSTVIGAKSNLPGIMMVFAKTYIQLKKSENNEDLQSHVLAMDRILTKNDIRNQKNKLKLFFKKSEKDPSKYTLNTYFNGSENMLQHVILAILEKMTPQSLPDAYGHNKPLYIADKVAKFYLNEFKRLLSSIGNWIANDKHNKEKNLNKSFRENRTEFEHNRYLEIN